MAALFQFTEPTDTVEAHLPDGRIISGKRGAPVGDFLRLLEDENENSPIVGALVNNQLRELTYPLNMECRVKPLTMRTEDGMRIYRRSLTFILEIAFEKVISTGKLTIDHSVAQGGYYCQISGRHQMTEEEMKRVEAAMWGLVEKDMPFYRDEIPLDQVIEYFEKKGYDDKVRLLAHRKKDYLVLYRLGDHYDYHHGYMVPSTGYLKWFGLQIVDGGFILRFPRRNTPKVLSPLPNYPQMLKQFRDYGNLLERLGIVSVGSLNDAVLEGRIRSTILVSEAIHSQRLAQIAREIDERGEKLRIILIAGPSSSGKTTSSKRLSVQLLARGLSPLPLELDNYFVPRNRTPRDEKGDYNFESLQALDLKRLNEDLKKLIAGKKVKLPRYNFLTGEVEPGEVIELKPRQILILEGIHGLNPDLIPDIPKDVTFRIYISALTQLNLDRHNRVSTTDTRLLRRIVRDARDRGYNAQTTIKRWESVTRGEKRNIFPYQENCDFMFNSALVYELGALKSFAEPLLRQVPHGTQELVEAKRLLSLLEWFTPIPKEIVPDYSILREFLGGSILADFRVWHAG